VDRSSHPEHSGGRPRINLRARLVIYERPRRGPGVCRPTARLRDFVRRVDTELQLGFSSSRVCRPRALSRAGSPPAPSGTRQPTLPTPRASRAPSPHGAPSCEAERSERGGGGRWGGRRAWRGRSARRRERSERVWWGRCRSRSPRRGKRAWGGGRWGGRRAKAKAFQGSHDQSTERPQIPLLALLPGVA